MLQIGGARGELECLTAHHERENSRSTRRQLEDDFIHVAALACDKEAYHSHDLAASETQEEYEKIFKLICTSRTWIEFFSECDEVAADKRVAENLAGYLHYSRVAVRMLDVRRAHLEDDVDSLLESKRWTVAKSNADKIAEIAGMQECLALQLCCPFGQSTVSSCTCEACIARSFCRRLQSLQSDIYTKLKVNQKKADADAMCSQIVSSDRASCEFAGSSEQARNAFDLYREVIDLCKFGFRNSDKKTVAMQLHCHYRRGLLALRALRNEDIAEREKASMYKLQLEQCPDQWSDEIRKLDDEILHLKNTKRRDTGIGNRVAAERQTPYTRVMIVVKPRMKLSVKHKRVRKLC